MKRLKALKKCSNRLIFHPIILACHLQIDADPEPAYYFDTDPDPDYYDDADPDPDPDPTFQFQ
jgi:hypothetical protein